METSSTFQLPSGPELCVSVPVPVSRLVQMKAILTVLLLLVAPFYIKQVHLCAAAKRDTERPQLWPSYSPLFSLSCLHGSSLMFPLSSFILFYNLWSLSDFPAACLSYLLFTFNIRPFELKSNQQPFKLDECVFYIYTELNAVSLTIISAIHPSFRIYLIWQLKRWI